MNFQQYQKTHPSFSQIFIFDFIEFTLKNCSIFNNFPSIGPNLGSLPNQCYYNDTKCALGGTMINKTLT
jgi:hypothetical protein